MSNLVYCAKIRTHYLQIASLTPLPLDQGLAYEELLKLILCLRFDDEISYEMIPIKVQLEGSMIVQCLSFHNNENLAILSLKSSQSREIWPNLATPFGTIAKELYLER